jgi:hypothetical protein
MQKPPSKPLPTVASNSELVRHYNSQVPAYNQAIEAMDEKRRPASGRQQQFEPASDADGPIGLNEWNLTRDELIDMIRKQNHRLGRHIKARSHELLLEHVCDSEGNKILKDGRYTTGHTYQHILDILAAEFPEASTSVACLRWYVVHMRSDASDEGLKWPDLPQVRPRSTAKKLML